MSEKDGSIYDQARVEAAIAAMSSAAYGSGVNLLELEEATRCLHESVRAMLERAMAGQGEGAGD